MIAFDVHTYLQLFMSCESRLDANPRNPLSQKRVGDKLQQSQASRGVAHRHRPHRHHLVGSEG